MRPVDPTPTRTSRPAAQMRLQPRGYAHSTAIDGDKTYRNVTVELLLPQKAEANLCAAVMAGQPLHCPASQSEQNESNWTEQPQFETDRSTVSLVRVPSATIRRKKRGS